MVQEKKEVVFVTKDHLLTPYTELKDDTIYVYINTNHIVTRTPFAQSKWFIYYPSSKIKLGGRVSYFGWVFRLILLPPFMQIHPCFFPYNFATDEESVFYTIPYNNHPKLFNISKYIYKKFHGDGDENDTPEIEDEDVKA